MYDLITRRQALHRIGLLVGGTLSASTIAGVLGGCRSPSGDEAAGYAYQALTEDQQRTLAALVDQIIPATDTPGASEAGVPQFIDTMLAEWYAPDERDRFLAGLAEVDRRVQAEHGAPLADLEGDAQVAFVTALDRETHARAPQEPAVDDEVAEAAQQGTFDAEQEQNLEVAGTQGDLGEAMAADSAADRSAALAQGNRAGTGETGGDPNARPPAEQPDVNPDAPPFFRQLKELTLAGYYTSEVGATQELQWLAAPGRYDADVPLSEIGRAWA